MPECEVCRKKTSLYRCPRCSLRTCSAVCVRRHKDDSGCSGERDRTAFINRSEYDETDLMSDYNLLEELNRGVDSSAREEKSSGAFGKPSRRSKQLRAKLKRQAHTNGVHLLFLPHGFSRSARNTSVVKEKGTIFWRLEVTISERVVAVQTGSQAEFVVLDRVPETSTIADVIELALERAAAMNKKPATDVTRQEEALLVFMEAEREKGSTFWPLDVNSTLAESVQGRTVIEFPRLVLVHRSESDKFRIAQPVSTEPSQSAAAEHSDSDSIPGSEGDKAKSQ
ncbi:hypothetical protein NDN08_003001 [Rhodosorus marinus]|uniref:HIT-type domain-containing protein n=1 Tax=Rhodosorus marinus TaxID=101924 RepID=A0AAV8UY03_9RHOD|nr:hypothetical protein NDN08_003001 [Rhodosorus marinus]